ncbi:hypothetical protein DL764_000155 [Monosporascus ibericus]|uniref:Uncharacterized protein n=1 Tax=Monosporascus ibericus TaxID=155417 RepID=A0A4Q4TYB3_9PEZI|nr:hypothetical protein DL764_000155 [Monosporascus ibericus]
MPEYPGPGNPGQGQRPPQPQPPAPLRPRPGSSPSRLAQLSFAEFHHAMHQEFLEFFSRMAGEIRVEHAIDKRNNLYYRCRNLLDAIAERLQRFKREGTVLDDDLLCAQADYDSLHRSIKAVWIKDYDSHQMATNGRLPTLWEENPAHQEEVPQDAMEEESQARQFEREARANLDDLTYRQMLAKGDREESKKDREESKENKEEPKENKEASDQ